MCHPPTLNCSVARGVEKGLVPAVGLLGVPAAHRAMAICSPHCVSIKVPVTLHMVHRASAVCGGRRSSRGAQAQVAASENTVESPSLQRQEGALCFCTAKLKLLAKSHRT